MTNDLELKVGGELSTFEAVEKVTIPLARASDGAAFLDVSGINTTKKDVASGRFFYNSNGELEEGEASFGDTNDGGGWGADGTERINGNGIPIEIATDREMNLSLRGDNLGRVFKFTGADSDVYEYNGLYMCVGGYKWADSI